MNSIRTTLTLEPVEAARVKTKPYDVGRQLMPELSNVGEVLSTLDESKASRYE